MSKCDLILFLSLFLNFKFNNIFNVTRMSHCVSFIIGIPNKIHKALRYFKMIHSIKTDLDHSINKKYRELCSLTYFVSTYLISVNLISMESCATLHLNLFCFSHFSFNCYTCTEDVSRSDRAITLFKALDTIKPRAFKSSIVSCVETTDDVKKL